MKKLVSPLPWVGSKRQLRDQIIPLIPDHKCYVEAFAGGAWVYLGKQPSEVEVLNDINGYLTTLYRIVRDEPDAFFDALWYLLPSRMLYKSSRDILALDGKNELTEVERAATFYYHIKNAFRGRFGSGFALSRTRPPRHMIAYELLVALRDRLQGTYIENLSYDRLIRNYDSPDTFFYLDPPYLMEKGDKCYQFEFSTEDHARLRSILGELKGKFLLSYGDCQPIRELYHGYRIDVTKEVTYTLSGKAKKKTELLISNY